MNNSRISRILGRSCAVFAFLGAATLGHAADAVVTGDTYINASVPGSNFGTAVNLNIVGGATPSSALVQFDLSKLPSDPTLITKATATFYVNKVNAAGGVDVKKVE